MALDSRVLIVLLYVFQVALLVYAVITAHGRKHPHLVWIVVAAIASYALLPAFATPAIVLWALYDPVERRFVWPGSTGGG
ncbi:MAG: hypothetical protein JRG84_07860 [Deltaproteobacteria bacterium]|nr:hypothetical protein [Deltaproteobacteria bacterium]